MSPLDTQPVTPLEQQQIHSAGNAGETFWHRVRFQLVGQVASRSSASTVLDIGAGSGLLGTWLARHAPGCAYRFDEASPRLDAALAERFGADHRFGSDAPISADTLVTLLDVAEHVEDDIGLLRGICSRMEPGGQLMLTVPALSWAYTSWDTHLGHHRRYSRRDVLRLAASAGLSVSSCSYLFPELLPLVVLRKFRRSPREHVDFPQLPVAIDRAAAAVSRTTTALRRIWPAGTSVVAILTKPAAS